ncbi:hypothetical protein C5167_039625 [Papaver somniferum]|uniref:Uncharacterized protein n=1 Tax=Papaver somniferum TaxID=3469 RepID=A0A4Y7IF52_PAPSO|nr:hypothetical protein C5167_039625 [Papaver somniferum]
MKNWSSMNFVLIYRDKPVILDDSAKDVDKQNPIFPSSGDGDSASWLTHYRVPKFYRLNVFKEIYDNQIGGSSGR